MEDFHGATLHRTKSTWGICFGQHIYVGENAKMSSVQHEYGHHLQWKQLKWLYWFVIALPSLIHCAAYVICGRMWDYYTFYTEAWADQLACKYFGEDITKSRKE